MFRIAVFFLCSLSVALWLSAKEYLVGVEYFAGWYPEYPTKWHEPGGMDWREKYPERIPMFGEANSQETMDADIALAASHGVDFFSILWYPNASAERNVAKINKAVRWFMDSPNARYMKFMLEITNHAPFNVKTKGEWDAIAKFAAEVMTHPSYLKIDGRPALKIHGGGQFMDDLSHDAAKANEILESFRKIVKAAVGEEPIISVGLTQAIAIKDTGLKDINMDFSMEYADMPALPYSDEDYPYALMAETFRRDRLARIDDTVPFVPFVAVGWNPRPWRCDGAAFAFPTREEWKGVLESVKKDLDEHPRLGFPKKDGTCQKAFTIYAWNEYGEGGFMVPNKSGDNMKLEVVKEVFGAEEK